MKFFSNINIRHNLQTHIIGIFISLLLCTFVTLMGYSYRENTKAIIDLGESFITHRRNNVIKEIGDKCLARPLDIVAVKGKNEGIKIYELVGITQGGPGLLPSKNQIAFCSLFTKDYQLYTERRWEEAIETFLSIQQKFVEDHTVLLYIKRCKEFKKSPPPQNWDGVVVLKEK